MLNVGVLRKATCSDTQHVHASFLQVITIHLKKEAVGWVCGIVHEFGSGLEHDFLTHVLVHLIHGNDCWFASLSFHSHPILSVGAGGTVCHKFLFTVWNCLDLVIEHCLTIYRVGQFNKLWQGGNPLEIVCLQRLPDCSPNRSLQLRYVIEVVFYYHPE